MARMYPEDIDGFEAATEGERSVSRLMREATMLCRAPRFCY
jgi:hypothetical protein